MKKNLTLILCTLALVILITPAYAAKGRKGASDQAYKNASDDAMFNRTGDWFATIGKTDAEKEKIIAERREIRAQKRVQKEARKQERETEREQKRLQKKTKGRIKNIQEEE